MGHGQSSPCRNDIYPDELARDIFSECPLKVIDIIFEYWEPITKIEINKFISKKNIASMESVKLNQISNRGAMIIGLWLRQNRILTHLDLSNNKIENEGARGLAYGLKLNDTLTSFDIRQNPHIGFIAAQAFTATIMQSGTIENFGGIPVLCLKKNDVDTISINLSQNMIGDTEAVVLGACIMVNSILTEINLCENHMSVAGIKALADGFKYNTIVKTVILLNGDIPISQFHDGRRRMIDLSSRKYIDDDACLVGRMLWRNSSLFYLVLKDNKIGDIGIQEICEGLMHNTALLSLNIEDNLITNKGSEAIRELLKKNSILTELKLSRNKIGTIGTQKISEGLKDNSTLKELHLTRNNIGDVGIQGIGQALKKNSSLAKIYLAENNFGCLGAEKLSEGLKSNSTILTIEISANNIGDKGMKYLCAALKNNISVEKLRLNHNRIGNDGAVAIAKLLVHHIAMKILELNDNKIGNIGAEEIGCALEKNKMLISLDLRSNKQISKSGSKAISDGIMKNTSIVTFGEINVTKLKNNFPAWKKISFAGKTMGNAEAMLISNILKINTVLTSIDVRHNPDIGPSGAESLLNVVMKSNTVKNFSGIAVKALKEIRATLKEIYLDDTGCGDTEAIFLASLLKHNPTVTYLSVGRNNVTDIGCQAIANLLKTNTSLLFLYLSSNQISDKGAKAIAESLKDNNTLTYIQLNENQIGDAGAEAIAEALTINSGLQSLHISYCKFTKKGQKELKQATRNHPACRDFSFRFEDR